MSEKNMSVYTKTKLNSKFRRRGFTGYYRTKWCTLQLGLNRRVPYFAEECFIGQISHKSQEIQSIKLLD